VNWDLKRYGIAVGCTAALIAIHQPAQAAQTEITGVQVTPAGQGFELVLKIQGNSRPPVFTVNRGNASVADINNAQLRLPSGQSFNQPNPATGMSGVEIRQLDANTVRVTVQGTQAAPASEPIRRDDRQGLMVLRFNPAGTISGDSTTSNNTPSTGPSANVTPPFLKRASAPPVGDIAVGALNVASDTIDLNSTQVIPKLLLRNAPVREVLTLLGRASGVNVAFAEGDAAGDAANPASGPTISLDIENESVQDVFNYVLRLSGLDANKVGNTVFVGKTLPGDAQNRVVRTLRLNQLRATGTTKITNSLTTKSDIGGKINTGSAGDGGATSGDSTSASTTGRRADNQETFEEKGALEILEAYGANGGGSGGGQTTTAADLLKGVQVVADGRTNTVTLIGSPRRVEIAAGILQQLDIRRRQAAVNVKIVDVNLAKTKELSTDLQFRANNSLGFGFRPTGTGTTAGAGLGIVLGAATAPFTGGLTQLTNQVLGSLLVSVKNDNAKILTNPTLIVQEGSSAQVNLTQEIFSGIIQTTSSSASDSGGRTDAVTRKPNIRQAGVIFNVTVDRIDDNGFITLNLAPEVSAPSESFNVDGTTGTLISQRRLETGKVRLRDGQTLVLTGIIQDTDRRTVSKVPILGDIPLLGQLFRRETGNKGRQELVVIVTPRILDDSQESGIGYQYSPGADAQQLLNK
jgi:type IV pilus assembly protein PilQ